MLAAAAIAYLTESNCAVLLATETIGSGFCRRSMRGVAVLRSTVTIGAVSARDWIRRSRVAYVWVVVLFALCPLFLSLVRLRSLRIILGSSQSAMSAASIAAFGFI